MIGGISATDRPPQIGRSISATEDPGPESQWQRSEIQELGRKEPCRQTSLKNLLPEKRDGALVDGEMLQPESLPLAVLAESSGIVAIDCAAGESRMIIYLISGLLGFMIHKLCTVRMLLAVV